MKAPIAEAVDDNWSSGLRQNVALQGQVVPDYCNDWMPGDSLCKPNLYVYYLLVRANESGANESKVSLGMER
jgi:hypothetical protein